MKHLNVKIYGTVQGVFFRHSAREKAQELGVTGFARNEPDDTVYIEIEGKEEALKEFFAWCQGGPPLAEIEKVEYEWSDKLKGFYDFAIR